MRRFLAALLAGALACSVHAADYIDGVIIGGSGGGGGVSSNDIPLYEQDPAWASVSNLYVLSSQLFTGAGTTGLVTSSGTDVTKFLRGDGTWQSITTGGAEADPIFTEWASTNTYIQAETDPIFLSVERTNDWNTAFGWGDHALAGYLTAYTETDPVHVAFLSAAWNTHTNDSSAHHDRYTDVEATNAVATAYINFDIRPTINGTNVLLEGEITSGTNGATGPQGPQGIPGVDGTNGAAGPQGIQGIPGVDGTNGAAGPIGPQGIQGIPGVDGTNGAAGPIGPQGIQGIQGIPGVDGTNGVNGIDGIDGTNGVTGPIGPQGIPGVDGIDGTNGAAGPVGPQGIQGIPGVDGTNGAAGPIGPQGIQGIPGVDGIDGTNGAAGPIGPQGIQGIQGIPGVDGTNGVNGIDGIDGTNGAAGPIGPQGIQGIPGVDGTNGAAGPIGPQGIQGIQGIPGIDGTNGVNGIDGTNGAAGPIGPQGIQGIPGVDGIDGTNGATGPQGPQGIQGIPGVDGTNGATGPQGPQGIPGVDGTNGVSYGLFAGAGTTGVVTSVVGDAGNFLRADGSWQPITAGGAETDPVWAAASNLYYLQSAVDTLLADKVDELNGGATNLNLQGATEQVTATSGKQVVNYELLASYVSTNSGSGVVLQLQWEFNSGTVDTDPGNGRFKLNNAVQPNATFIYVDDLTDDGLDATSVVQSLGSNDFVYVQQLNDASKVHLFRITGDVVDTIGYSKIPVTLASTLANDLDNGELSAFVLYCSGDVETDPTVNAAAKGITSTQTNEWSQAFDWGDHALAGYLTSYTETDPVHVAFLSADWLTHTNASDAHHARYTDAEATNAVAPLLVTLSNDLVTIVNAGDTAVSNNLITTLGGDSVTLSNNLVNMYTTADTLLSNNTWTAFQAGDTAVSNWVVNQGYLTSYTEVDTLQSVTDRGNTTTNYMVIADTDTSLLGLTATNDPAGPTGPFISTNALAVRGNIVPLDPNGKIGTQLHPWESGYFQNNSLFLGFRKFGINTNTGNVIVYTVNTNGTPLDTNVLAFVGTAAAGTSTNLSDYVNDPGFLSVEADPDWNAASNSYYTAAQLSSTNAGDEGFRRIGVLGGYNLEHFKEETDLRGISRDGPEFTWSLAPSTNRTVSWSGGDIYDPEVGYFKLVAGNHVLTDDALNWAYWSTNTPNAIQFTTGDRPDPEAGNIVLGRWNVSLGFVLFGHEESAVADLVLESDQGHAQLFPSLIANGLEFRATGTSPSNILKTSGVEFRDIHERLDHDLQDLTDPAVNLISYYPTNGSFGFMQGTVLPLGVYADGTNTTAADTNSYYRGVFVSFSGSSSMHWIMPTVAYTNLVTAQNGDDPALPKGWEPYSPRCTAYIYKGSDTNLNTGAEYWIDRRFKIRRGDVTIAAGGGGAAAATPTLFEVLTEDNDTGGILPDGMGAPSAPDQAANKGYVDSEITAHAAIADEHHTRYTDAEATNAVFSAIQSGSLPGGITNTFDSTDQTTTAFTNTPYIVDSVTISNVPPGTYACFVSAGLQSSRSGRAVYMYIYVNGVNIRGKDGYFFNSDEVGSLSTMPRLDITAPSTITLRVAIDDTNPQATLTVRSAEMTLLSAVPLVP